MLPAAAFGCGSDSDCRLGERHCRIHIPKQSADHAMPALVFAHGFRGSAAGVMKNTAMIRWANDKGVALIALKSAGLDWDIPFAPRTFDSDGHAEEAYVQAVLEDAQKRFGIDRARVIMSGFSAGGMMTWHMACDRPDLFSGYVPMAGTFWLQTPDTCASLLKPLIHIHGDQDDVVPFEGRQIRNTHQGNVFESLDLYRDLGAFFRITGGE